MMIMMMCHVIDCGKYCISVTHALLSPGPTCANIAMLGYFKGSFQKKTTTMKHMEISICWGEGGSGGGPFPYVFTIVPKCFLSHFKHF